MAYGYLILHGVGKTAKRFRSTLILLIILCHSYVSWAQPKEIIDWKYEIDLLGKELTKRHCNLYFQTDSAAFFKALNHIADEAADRSLFEISVQLQQVIASLGDANTRINYHFNIDAKSILPLDLYWFEDGVYILESRAVDKNILGKRLIAINGFQMDQIIDSLSTLIVIENPFFLKSQLPRMLTWTPLLDHFGFTNSDTLMMEYENDKGVAGKLSMHLTEAESELIRVEPEKLPLGWQDQQSYFRDQYFPDDRIYYIQYNKCWSRECEEEYGTGATALFMPSFKEFQKQIFQTIKKQNIDKLVFDMRFNSGGDPIQGTKLIKKLSKARFKGLGNFYVIVGRQTFSSAIINAIDFKKNTNALIVGEGTGGRPNFYGEVNRFVLPESRMVVNYSTTYVRLLDQDSPSITPNIEAPISFSQYMKGIDPAMELIRKHPWD